MDIVAGPNMCGSGASLGGPPGAGAAWSNPGYIAASGAATSAALNCYSNYLSASNFGFAIPAGATIYGVFVEASLKAQYASQDNDYSVNLYLPTYPAETHDDNARPTQKWPSSYTTRSWGGVTLGAGATTWGWTAAQLLHDVNLSGFSVVISVQNPAGSPCLAYIDWVRMSIGYTILEKFDSVACTEINGVLPVKFDGV